jgi:hypothetical protein
MCSKAIERRQEIAQKYKELLRTDLPKADAYLSRLMDRRAASLPQYMIDHRDASRFVTGHAVLEAAADHIALRGKARSQQLPLRFKEAIEGRCRRLLREARADVRNSPEERQPITQEEHRTAVARINSRKQCVGIPYAAVRAMPPGV